jgi:hypothetical protein
VGFWAVIEDGNWKLGAGVKRWGRLGPVGPTGGNGLRRVSWLVGRTFGKRPLLQIIAAGTRPA